MGTGEKLESVLFYHVVLRQKDEKVCVCFFGFFSEVLAIMFEDILIILKIISLKRILVNSIALLALKKTQRPKPVY